MKALILEAAGEEDFLFSLLLSPCYTRVHLNGGVVVEWLWSG